jgi:hypothetical protein
VLYCPPAAIRAREPDPTPILVVAPPSYLIHRVFKLYEAVVLFKELFAHDAVAFKLPEIFTLPVNSCTSVALSPNIFVPGV